MPTHFCHERKKCPECFDKRSFRTLVRGAHRIVIACPKGKWNDRDKCCCSAMQVQVILHPKTEEKCRNFPTD